MELYHDEEQTHKMLVPWLCIFLAVQPVKYTTVIIDFSQKLAGRSVSKSTENCIMIEHTYSPIFVQFRKVLLAMQPVKDTIDFYHFSQILAGRSISKST